MPTRDSRRDDDLQREIRLHLELEAEERKAEGLSTENARRAASLAFGNVVAVREDARAVWSPLWLQQAGQDLRYALRVARRTPGFTLGAILVLAIGISASTTIFGALKAVVLEPMPFAQPAQLVRLAQTNSRAGSESLFCIPASSSRLAVTKQKLQRYRCRTGRRRDRAGPGRSPAS